MKNKIKKYLLNILAKSRKQKGFTLIEMVVVIAIIVILMLLIVPNLLGQKKNADTKTGNAFRITVQTQVELYKEDKNKIPTNFDQLVRSGYLTSDQKQKAEKNGYSITKDGEVTVSNGKG